MAKREVIQIPGFSRRVKELIRAHKLKEENFETFKSVLAEHPEMGDVIQGTGGVRKARLRSASKGKSGGFRVCYYFLDVGTGRVYLLTIYSKNEKEDLSANEKKELKELVNVIKRK
ncbi:MAG: type II toxin-antitoxin system RelE/ParE family toxin [Verrucomicrobia bacterium]|nr:type II toxin-antitoxin system RelE/ParE family toxin [Verrucomicrobiota bacterium]